MTKEDYNDEPIHFCKDCLSIKIRFTREDIDYCDTCGSVDIGTIHVFDWIHFYIKKYEKPFLNLNKKNYVKKS